MIECNDFKEIAFRSLFIYIYIYIYIYIMFYIIVFIFSDIQKIFQGFFLTPKVDIFEKSLLKI